jgi:hypothetical protein
MYNQNIFETASRVIPLLQQAEWKQTKQGLYKTQTPVDVTSCCGSAQEAALVAQAITRILYESSYFKKDIFLFMKLDDGAPTGAGSGKILLSGNLPQKSDLARFKADHSLALPASGARVSAKPPANLREAMQYVRDAAVMDWTRSAQGDYTHTLPVSHGPSGEILLFNENNADQINAMLDAHPDYKNMPDGEKPRLKIDAQTRPTVITVRKKDAERILVGLLGLDGEKLAIPSARARG